MSFLSIPPELRLRIYAYLPELEQDHYETLTSYSKLTPAICRTSQILRRETIPLFASNALFAIQMDDTAICWRSRVSCWLAALGPTAVSRIRSLQISQHWALPQPARWQRHVGFYVRVEKRKQDQNATSPSTFRPEWQARFVQPTASGMWQVTTGTYPVARDMRGMRLESVELLAETVRQRLHVPTPVAHRPASEVSPGLLKEDVHFLLAAMDVVGSHPISTYDIEQGDAGRRSRHQTWFSMVQQLQALNLPLTSAGNCLSMEDVDATQASRIYTPY